MKEAVKKYSTELLLAFIFSFMMYFYEPLLLYCSNIYDFWFDIYLYFKYVVFLFLVMFVVFFLILLLLRKIFKERLSKYISYILFIFSYVQGNILVGGLAPIDGFNLIPDPNEFYIGNLLSFILFAVVIIVVNKIFKKMNIKKINKVINYSVLIIFVMLLTATVSLVFKKDFFIEKESVYATQNNLNSYSNNKNFIVLVVDSIDSRTFDYFVKDKSLLNDFTYYPDTLSSYPYTRYSIPLILTGKNYLNEEPFVDFYTKSIEDSKIIDKLNKDKYSLNVYTPEVLYNNENYKKISNIDKANSINFINLIKVQTKYSFYKYSAYSLKFFANISKLNFNDLKPGNYYVTDNKNFYDSLDDIKVIDNNMYKLIHIDGGHTPRLYGENMNKVNNGTYEDGIKASISIVEKLLKTLKDNNLYDNSAIIILADHGNITDSIKGRTNPMLYIKGFNEKHDYNISGDRASYNNLEGVLLDLLDGNDSKELFKKYDNTIRRVYLYEFNKDKDIMEFIQPSNAWDFNALYYSGKNFRKK